MTKLEEIREEIAKMLSKIFWEGYNKWYEVGRDYPFDERSNEILTYLHSQGVVIKVERKLPRLYTDGILYEKSGEQILDEIRKTGFEAVEPLIIEDNVT